MHYIRLLCSSHINRIFVKLATSTFVFCRRIRKKCLFSFSLFFCLSHTLLSFTYENNLLGNSSFDEETRIRQEKLSVQYHVRRTLLMAGSRFELRKSQVMMEKVCSLPEFYKFGVKTPK